MFPDDLRYTAEHEWVRPGATEGATDGDGENVRVGITDHAQEQLGDIVFVSLPEVGSEVRAGEPCGELESTKSVSDIYAPVTGTVVARNAAVETAPELINSEPYGQGWMFEIRPAEAAEVGNLMDADGYAQSLVG